MHNFLVEMCRSCLKQDVPLFETMGGEENKKKVKTGTLITSIIQDLFCKDIIEEYNWKLCEDCTVLLKGAIILKKGLRSSKLVYNKYLSMFDGNNIVSSNTFYNLSVQIPDINLTTEKEDVVKERYEFISVPYIIDECTKTEFQFDADSLDGGVETKFKIEIDEDNYENMLNDFHCVEETSLNIKSDPESDITMDSTEDKSLKMAVEQCSILQSDSKDLLQLHEGTKVNTDEDYNNESKETKAVNFKSKKKSLICSKCDQKFTRKQSFVLHLRTHRVVKKYECDLCAKTFRQKECYKAHRLVHAGEKPYKCDFCTKAFSDRSNCIVHTRLHTGEKPYKCDWCSKRFSDKSHYNKHKRIHTGEKPYKCDFCVKAFAQKSDYDRHRRIHTGERPYRCDICIKTFLLKVSYKKHKMEAHSDR